MIYKRLLTGIVTRVLLLTLTLFGIVSASMRYPDPLVLANLGLLLVLQVILFIRSQNQVNRKLKAFFDSFRFDDLAFTHSDGFRDPSFTELYSSMEGILQKVEKMNLENLRQKQYFQSLADHAGVGIMAVSDSGEFRLVNNTLKQMLRITGLSSLGELERVSGGLASQLEKIEPGEQKLISLTLAETSDLTGDPRMQLSIRCTEVKIENERIRILTFHDIRAELEDAEFESWQKVIRVLTHEITNSTGPIASAAQTLLELLDAEEIRAADDTSRFAGIRDDLQEGLRIIRERSLGMEEFVRQFRQVTLVREPQLEKIGLEDLFQGIRVLFTKQMEEQGIPFTLSVEPGDRVFYADRKLVEQALINLVGNSIQAVSSSADKSIHLEASGSPGRQCMISVTDSGNGIREEDLDKIFIPFYSTREGGSGIGLSLVRNIMRMHRGSVQVSSQPGRGATFRMLF